MKITRLLWLVPVVLLCSACSRHAQATRTVATPARGAPDSSASSGARRIEGSVPSGATYALNVPTGWNGHLVLYAHGYTPPSAPLALPAPRELEPILRMGYAVAYSSYSETGYAVKDGAERTHELRGIFARRVGRPRRTYLIGHSLGGIIALKLAEEHPDLYSGALLVSGVLGGTTAELAYLSNVRVMFDCCFPNVLPGTLLVLPDSLDFQGRVRPALVAAVLADTSSLVALAQVEQSPLPYADSGELIKSVLRALGFQFTALHDLLKRTHGESFFDNSATRYSGSLPAERLARLNACAARYRTGPGAAEFLSCCYEPTGRLRVPLLTLHRPRDPEVPLFHEALYRARVDRRGRVLLVQRTIAGYGHDDFAAEELARAFADLAAWVEGGAKPSP